MPFLSISLDKNQIILCYGLPHVTVFRTKDWLHLQHILYEGFYTSNIMYVPFGAVLENIRRIFHVTASPLQSLLVPHLRSPSSDGETTVPSLSDGMTGR